MIFLDQSTVVYLIKKYANAEWEEKILKEQTDNYNRKESLYEIETNWQRKTT